MNPAEQHLPHHLQRCATVPMYLNQPDPEVYDELNPKDKIQVRKLIPKKEKILYSGSLKKINKRLIPQNRILVVTDKAIYNIQPKEDFFISLAFSISPGSALKRKIDIQKVFAITLSVRAIGEHEQFVIHVNGEYDYRYDAGPKCERIIKSILKSYFIHFKVPFILYLKDEADLVEFHTTDDDLKASVDKRPKDGKIFVTPEIMAKGLGWIISNRKVLLQQTNMFYSIPSMPTTMSKSQDQFVQQASISTGPQFQIQGQNTNLNPFQIVNNNNGVQVNPLHRAQSLGNQPNIQILSPPSHVNNNNNAQLNFLNTGNNQSMGTNNNVNMYQGGRPVGQNEQFDFVPTDLVSTTANYNVQITTNFEDSLSRRGQNGVYYQ